MSLEVETPRAFRALYDPPLGAMRYRVHYGGRGSAKSWQYARALLIHGYQRPLRVLCAREYQASIRESVHHLLDAQIGALGLRGFYSVGQAEVTGPNGTQFIFKGLRRDPDGVRSTEGVDICWVEEGHTVSKESWQVLTPTIRKPDSEIWVTFNPGEETDATYRMFVTTPPPRSLIQRVGYKDNPWLPAVLAEEAATMRLRDPEAYAHVWGGEPWTRSDAQVLVGKWRVEEFTPADHWQGPYYGADFGFANDPAVMVKLWISDEVLYVEYDTGAPRLDMDQLAEMWATVPGAKEQTSRADSSRPETIHEMNRRGFRMVAAPKWDGSVKDGIAHLRGYRHIVIHPRCTRAISEARLWRYKTSDAGDVLPILIDAHNHVWDASRYGLAPLIRQRLTPFIPTRA